MKHCFIVSQKMSHGFEMFTKIHTMMLHSVYFCSTYHYPDALGVLTLGTLDAIEREWRPLFALAWADFQRFLKGWSPEHYKINAYSEALTERGLEYLDSKK